MVDLLDSSEKIIKLYLIRHGSTEATDTGKVCGHLDLDMTPGGILEIEDAADWFRGVEIDGIFCSPLKRAMQTADIIAKATDVPTYFKHSGLSEKQEGEWEGKTYWQIRDADPKHWEKWSKDPIKHGAPNGESVKDFVARVGRALDDILKNHNKGNKLALVTHAGVIKAIIMHALNIPIENFFRIEVPPGSISRVDWSESFASLKFTGLCPSTAESMVV